MFVDVYLCSTARPQGEPQRPACRCGLGSDEDFDERDGFRRVLLGSPESASPVVQGAEREAVFARELRMGESGCVDLIEHLGPVGGFG